MKKKMSWPVLILLTVTLAFCVNYIGSAVNEEYKYNKDLPTSATNTLQKLIQVIGLYEYVGYARSGATQAQAVWSIYRYYNAGTGAVCSLMFYEGDSSFNAIWDAKESATYR